jgi:hypothetical protein
MDFGYFPTGDPPFGLGLRGLVTTGFQNYADVPDQVAPGFYGITLVFPGPPTPFVPLLFVTVTERTVRPVGGGIGQPPVLNSQLVAQGQMVIGKIEDAVS